MPATTLTDRAVLKLSGEDVGPFLDGLVTNHVGADLPVWAGLLTPQGKCLFDFFVFADGDDFLIDGEAAHIKALGKRLSMYKLRRKIDIAVDPDLAVHWLADGDGGAADPRHPDMGRRWIGPAGEPATGYDAHRLRLGICEGNAELGDLLWLECNAGELNGVSFTKGCFVGQENTARMNWRSKVNRRLFVVPGRHEKARAYHAALDLSVVHARAADRPENALMPDWLAAAVAT